MWKNIVEPGRPQITILCMRIACWIPESTSIQSEYVILTAFPPQQWLHEHIRTLSVLLTLKITFIRNILLESFRRFGETSYFRLQGPCFHETLLLLYQSSEHWLPTMLYYWHLPSRKIQNIYISFETGCSEVLTLFRTTIIQTDVT
jgi:hypothetical protein